MLVGIDSALITVWEVIVPHLAYKFIRSCPLVWQWLNSWDSARSLALIVSDIMPSGLALIEQFTSCVGVW